MSIREHNVGVGAKWSSAGKDYDEIGREIADSIQHAVDRLAQCPQQSINDELSSKRISSNLIGA